MWFVIGSSKDTGIVMMQFVSGTEYNIGDAGQVIVEIRDVNSNTLNANCSMLVWYPDKSVFLQQGAVLSATGNYFINFTVPNVTGIFEYQANCTRNEKSYVTSKSFHVSEFQNATTARLNRIKAGITK
jgi:uncharacterized protein YfaS (alpha-2-macroglobulin family)